MATLLHLAKDGVVAKLDAALDFRTQEVRQIYVLPRARERMENSLPEWGSDWQIELSPIEQLDAFLNTYCSGDVLVFDRQFHPVRHIADGVWELKTADLRLFGWFSVKDTFVCSNIDLASKVKQHRLYDGYRREAVHDRDSLDLDPPKFIPGDDPNAVVSAFSYPES